jgi:hypothetical protein
MTIGRGTVAEIKTVEIEGQTFGLRVATIEDIENIEKQSGVKLGKTEDFSSNMAFAIATIINQVVDPESGKRVFGVTDTPMLKAQPMDGWFKALVDAVGLCFPKAKDGTEGNAST